MTREQINTIFTDLGLEVPSKGVVNQLLNAFNTEKGNEIEAAKKTAKDEAEAKYKGFIKPEDHQKVLDELNIEKGKGALTERKAKYQKANLNIEDEDILNLIEAKLKDSKDFDKDLEAYVKAHPSFLKVKEEQDKKNPKQDDSLKQKITIGGAGSDKDNGQNKPMDLSSAISEHYSDNK